jgi:uncharacterized protein (DUF983 family)
VVAVPSFSSVDGSVGGINKRSCVACYGDCSVSASLPSSFKERFDGIVGVIVAMMFVVVSMVFVVFLVVTVIAVVAVVTMVAVITMVRAVQGSTSLEEFSVFVGVEVFNA